MKQLKWKKRKTNDLPDDVFYSAKLSDMYEYEVGWDCYRGKFFAEIYQNDNPIGFVWRKTESGAKWWCQSQHEKHCRKMAKLLVSAGFEVKEIK